AVGARIRTFGREWEVVGVVGDVHHFGPATPAEPMVYFPFAQDVITRRRMTFVLRTAGEPEALVGPARAVIHELDPQLAVSNVRGFGSLGAEKTAANRFSAVLVGAFAGLALLLAAVGVYGVTAFAVARRTREIGVRMALGASGRRVFLTVLRQAAAMLGVGAAAGVLAAIPLMRLMRGLLFGVGPGDPLTFAVVLAVLAAAALLATWGPARRAARLDPVAALRAE
ncbi:MAG: hypothetical protein IRZ00_16395, partial [Gemmatimonadetes bacterium]|nr:hypothetical protein [Gemmatimonadota bacterium]